MKPLALDLCCGNGGWTKGLLAEGWDVIGVDISESELYPREATLFLRDVVEFSQGHLQWLPPIALVVASPPCEQFSRHGMPWTRAKNPPEPDLAIVEACCLISEKLKAPLVMENVRTAQKWLGRSSANVGPFHLWGDIPPLVPNCIIRPKESYGSKERLRRAEIPTDLARWIARIFKPSTP